MNIKIKNWYPLWAFLSVFLYFTSILNSFGLSIGVGQSLYEKMTAFSFELFSSILIIFFGIMGIKKSKSLEGESKTLSFVFKRLGIFFLIFSFLTNLFTLLELFVFILTGEV